MASNDFTIDKVEYQSVFKVFDRDSTGKIQIEQVNHFIQLFEEVQIKAPEEAKNVKKGRELPVKGTWGVSDKRGAAAQASATSANN